MDLFGRILAAWVEYRVEYVLSNSIDFDRWMTNDGARINSIVLSLFLQLTMNDFSVHRIIGRGGFGEVYGCRKADTGKMYAMKCLDKKRIKMKQGETLALNERIMLSLVSTGVSIISRLFKVYVLSRKQILRLLQPYATATRLLLPSSFPFPSLKLCLSE